MSQTTVEVLETDATGDGDYVVTARWSHAKSDSLTIQLIDGRLGSRLQIYIGTEPDRSVEVSLQKF